MAKRAREPLAETNSMISEPVVDKSESPPAAPNVLIIIIQHSNDSGVLFLLASVFQEVLELPLIHDNQEAC